MSDELAPSAGPASVEPRGRTFGILDLMISICGIAILIAWGHYNIIRLCKQISGFCNVLAAYCGLAPAGNYGTSPNLMSMIVTHWSGVIWYVVQTLEMVVLISTPLFLLMRLRRPRPPILAMLRQPGTVAGLSVALGIVLIAGWIHRLFLGLATTTVAPVAVAATVSSAWVCLALSRRWRSERSWIDRMGRVIGVSAIATGLLGFINFGI